MFDYKNKKTLVIVAIAVIIVIGLIWGLIAFFRGGNEQPGGLQNIGGQPNLPAPVFLTEAEKESFGLPAEAKVQSLAKDNNGEVLVYKIIRSDSDIVPDPAAVGPISPRQRPSAR